MTKYFLVLFFLSANFASIADTKHKPSIIALSPHIVEMLYDIGAGEQIIGTTAFADYPEQAKNIPIIGNYLHVIGNIYNINVKLFMLPLKNVMPQYRNFNNHTKQLYQYIDIQYLYLFHGTPTLEF